MNSIPIDLILFLIYIIGAFCLSNKFVKQEKSIYYSLGWLYLYSIFFILLFIGSAYISGHITAQRTEKLCKLIIEDFRRDFLSPDFPEKIVVRNEGLKIEDIITKIKKDQYEIKFRDFFYGTVVKNFVSGSSL
jgi:hypothetical protein